MPEQRADERQARATRGELTGEGVAQIVDSQTNEPGGLAKAPPPLLDLDHMAAAAGTGEYIRTENPVLGALRGTNFGKKLSGRSGQRDLMMLFLLGG
jgi:hypothetical protein